MIAPTRMDVMRKAELCRDNPTDEQTYMQFITSLAWRMAHDEIERGVEVDPLWHATAARRLRNDDVAMLAMAYGIPRGLISRFLATARTAFVAVYREELIAVHRKDAK